jgi:CheY-like chemotaxis protein
MAEFLPPVNKNETLKHTGHIILLVEDDPDDLQMIKEALEIGSASLNIIHKKNGLEALDYLNGIKSRNNSIPCLIIMDINMPILTGKQLLSIIKNEEDFQAIPVIIFTTSSNDGDREFCNRFNVPMVTKPNGLQDFNSTVQKFIKHCEAA